MDGTLVLPSEYLEVVAVRTRGLAPDKDDRRSAERPARRNFR
jgi:hypothetical protein